MKNIVTIMLICVCLACGSLSAYAAGEVNKKPLNEVFDHMVIIPYDYQGKAFVNGQKTDVYGDYEIIQRNERVLVPIRLMGYLAEQSDPNSRWTTVWQAQNPNDVVMTNSITNKTIKFTVNSKTMMVNNKPQALDIAPQKINGRIVLPLRSAAEALDKKIDWLDGLILISDEYVNLQHPQTLAIKDQIKTELTDTRKPVGYDTTENLITKYGDSVYYIKHVYNENSAIAKLYKKADGQKEVQVKLPGTVDLENWRLIDGELYYVSMVNNKWELDVYNLANNKARKLVDLDDEWNSDEGWLDDIKFIDNEMYIILHSGDGTMGGDTLYKAANGALEEVMYAKSFINYLKAGEYIYYTDFHFMSVGDDNLNRLDTKSGEVTSIGEPGYAYGIHRTIDGQGMSYSSRGALYIKENYLYTLGYKDSNLEDASSIYKFSLADQKQIKLTSAANQFWIEDNKIYYIDSKTGYLGSVDLDGSNNQMIVKRKIGQVQFFNGSIYYNENLSGSFFGPGELYRYDMTAMKETKLSDKPVSSYYVGKSGVYYVSNGYDLGLYRIDEGNRNIRLVKDSINTAKITDVGMIYTLIYKEGIYSVK